MTDHLRNRRPNRAIATGLLACLALGACASTPQKTISRLDDRDPKYSSQECLDARNIALKYDDKTLSRMGMGAGLGLLLGPFGIPLAGVADMSQNDKRELINKEIQRRCVTPR